MRAVNITEATKEALKSNNYIIRTCWDWGLVVQPTDTTDCCIVLNADTKERVGQRWNPKAEDLTADDWELVK